MPVTRSLLVAVTFALFVGSALAQNSRFLRDAPISFMTREDNAMLLRNAEEALDSLPDGYTNGWLNPKTGHSGTATPLKPMKEQGSTCRLLEITNNAGSQSSRTEWTVCKTKDGWRTSGR
ncbi:MAG: RT0821/Lpp0805 family surface protein [Burkholderiales bacterium]